jgi:acylphosphatase
LKISKARAHVFISGRVQGVFFRAETRYIAEKLNVTGWVRNLPDGRVEAVFEGESKDVRKLIEFCKKGTSGAYVKRVEVQRENYTGDFRRFDVRYR